MHGLHRGRKHADMLFLLTVLHSTLDSPNLISELFLKNLLLATGLICSVCLRHNVAAHNLASRLLLMIIDIIHPLTNLIFSCGSRCAVFKCVSVQRILAALPILINDSRIIFFVLEYALLASFWFHVFALGALCVSYVLDILNTGNNPFAFSPSYYLNYDWEWAFETPWYTNIGTSKKPLQISFLKKKANQTITIQASSQFRGEKVSSGWINPTITSLPKSTHIMIKWVLK